MFARWNMAFAGDFTPVTISLFLVLIREPENRLFEQRGFLLSLLGGSCFCCCVCVFLPKRSSVRGYFGNDLATIVRHGQKPVARSSNQAETVFHSAHDRNVPVPESITQKSHANVSSIPTLSRP
jgi:hypothetical protein